MHEKIVLLLRWNLIAYIIRGNCGIKWCAAELAFSFQNMVLISKKLFHNQSRVQTHLPISVNAGLSCTALLN